MSKDYFTEIGIGRLYNVLSDKEQNQVLEYTRKLVQENSRKIVTVTENLYEYYV